LAEEDTADYEIDRVYGRGKKIDGVQIYVEPGEMSDPSSLNFSYEVQSFTDTSVQLKLDFDQASSVSVSPEPDYLVIVIKDFRDKSGNLIAKDQLIRKPIPTQMDGGATIIKALGSSVGSVLNAQFSFNMALNVLLNVSLNTLISSVKSL